MGDSDDSGCSRESDPPSPERGARPGARARARRWLSAVPRRLEGTWLGDFVTRLKALDIIEWTTTFGAELLWSVLPLLILLSVLANTRIEDDLSRHIGLNDRGAHIFESTFRNAPSHAFVPIATGLIIAFAGTVAVVASIQALYERAFDQEHRGRRDVLRLIVWVVVLIAVLVAQALISRPVRDAVGPVVQGFVRLLEATLFFWWTMHFLLAGRERWRDLLRPAGVTALLWLGLAFFSSRYFSSVIISDSKQFGTIGVVFTLLTWFILIGFVFVLGAAWGAVWQQRRGQGATGSIPDAG
jgi:membrane protein